MEQQRPRQQRQRVTGTAERAASKTPSVTSLRLRRVGRGPATRAFFTVALASFATWASFQTTLPPILDKLPGELEQFVYGAFAVGLWSLAVTQFVWMVRAGWKPLLMCVDDEALRIPGPFGLSSVDLEQITSVEIEGGLLVVTTINGATGVDLDRLEAGQPVEAFVETLRNRLA